MDSSETQLVLGSGEAVLLLGGALALVTLAFVASRVLRALRHGFSIRLQLFLAIWGTSLLTTFVIGVWAVDRVQGHMDDLSMYEAAEVLIRGFGPKSFTLFLLLGVVSALAAIALGRGLAQPIERLALSAEAIARGQRQAVLPPPVGREVRRLTEAFESMRRSLEDRHHIEQFVANLSHELKNPVSAIRAATEVLMEGAALDPEAGPRFLGRIDEAGRRLEALLLDLLALARLEAKGLERDEMPVALDEVVRGALRTYLPALEAKAVKLKDSLVAVELDGNARWLSRAVENLLDNAVRYSPCGSCLEVRLSLADGQAVLEVRDQGPGVSPRVKAKLFERFATDRADRGGTGLGLALVRSVAELHGGQVSVKDEPGGAFVLRLPARAR